VAFAAETAELDEAIANGHAKLLRKRADLIVVNEVGAGKAFGTEHNAAVILAADGERVEFAEAPKGELADAILDLVARRLG
jgi:phosphopantothenoylcysteine decarboxylase/phosphopantothenate--cysteine ligase